MFALQINITSLIVYGTAVVLLLLLTIVLFVIIHQRKVINYQLKLKEITEDQQNKLTLAAIETEEAERKRISSELHDEVGALLSAVKLYLNQIEPVHLSNEKKIDALNQSKGLLDEAVKTVRNISSNLQPVIIADFGLESTIQHFCNKINQPGVLSISLTAQDALVRLSPEKDLAIFRIIQELTNNIIKHAHSSGIHFSLVQKTDTIEIYIEYDGNGMDQQEYENKLYQVQGLGLKNIQNRLNILKGYVFYEKSDNLTNTITVRLPITEQKP
ncbi:sensor histidine kinase [Panacibacter ginsenosidivorans]|nr:histidine kinase [Panacibacter ginsenosidivorans]